MSIMNLGAGEIFLNGLTIGKAESSFVQLGNTITNIADDVVKIVNQTITCDFTLDERWLRKSLDRRKLGRYVRRVRKNPNYNGQICAEYLHAWRFV